MGFLNIFILKISKQMRRLFLFLIVFLFAFSVYAQTSNANTASKNPGTKTTSNSKSGYNINVVVTPYKNCNLYLGSYFGKFKNLVDSVFLDDKSEGTFKGKEKLPEGIYFIVSPQHSILFELFMDEEQHFSIKADTSNLNSVIITGSKENSLFHEYTSFLSQKIPVLTSLQDGLKKASSTDSAPINADLKKLNKVISDYRDNIIKTYPHSMLALFFEAVKRPDIPDKIEPAAAAYYMKEHYWDDVLFTDKRLLRTPFFDGKLDDYYKYYVSPEPDSVVT